MTFDLDPLEPERFIHPDRDNIRETNEAARRSRHIVAKPDTPTMSDIYAPGGIASRVHAEMRKRKS